MTSPTAGLPEADPAAPQISTKPSWREAMAVYLQPRVLVVLFLGFSSGLPLALSGSTLLVWMRESGVDLGTIGLFALVGTPYTLKFIWAPLVDALHVPLFTRAFGRRRGWLVFVQLLLIAAVLLLALTDPAKSPLYVAIGALLVATASATQDIVVDAFRVESLPEEEQAAGMASYVAAYRIGMLISTAGVLFLVSAYEGTGLTRTTAWMWGYVTMAAMVLIGTVTALLATEPEQSRRAEAATSGESALKRVIHAALGAFTEFLTRKDALTALAFVVLFKFTDAFSGTMTAPFVIDLGYSRNDYAAIVKGVGLAATLIGGFAGGYLARRYSLVASLWIGAVLQGGVRSGVRLAVDRRRQPMGAGAGDLGGEFHRRDRHRDLRRVPVGAVPEPAAHCDAIRPAHGTRRRRPHLPVGERRIRRAGYRLAGVLHHQRCGRGAELGAAGVATTPRPFRRARTGEGLGAARSSQRRREPVAYFTRLHFVTTASLIWPGSLAHATELTFSATCLPRCDLSCAAWASSAGTIWKVSGPFSRLHSPDGAGNRRGSLTS